MRVWTTTIRAVLCGGGCVVAFSGFAQAQTPDPAILEIVAIYASKNDASPDPRLRPMMADLQSLPYTSFSLIGARACTVTGGDRCGMKVTEDDYLVVRIVENAPRYLRINVLLNRRNRPVFNANLKINRNAGVVLTNARRDGPSLVVSVKVKERPKAVAVPAVR